MHFVFTHSHLLPDGTVVVQSDSASEEGVAAVEFSDGVSVEADCRRDVEDFILEVPAYRTAKGSALGAHCWRISRRDDGRRSYRKP